MTIEFQDKYCKRCNEFVCWIKIIEIGLFTEIELFCNHCVKYDKDFNLRTTEIDNNES